MPARLSKELVEHLVEAESTEPSREIPIIVMATSHEGLSELERAGFTPERVLEHIPAASGKASTRTVRAIAAIEGIESIDYDGQMHAL